MQDLSLRTLVDTELRAVLESVPYARDLVASGVPVAVRRNVELVVSELVANAVKHGSGPVGLRVDVGRGRVRIAVRDGAPVLATPPAERKGLHMVEHVASALGVEPSASGKTIWAVLDHPLPA
jgi:anti-sigma regulatory factor (Ser/Thr protein kinase)